MRHITMRRSEPCVNAGLVLFILFMASDVCAGGPPSSDFETSFARIIVKNCLNCHNPSDRKGGLDLSQKEGLSKGGKSGPVIAAGKPDDSYLIERVREGSMPPKDKGRRLAPAEVAALVAEKALGNREFFLNKPYGIGSVRRRGDAP